MRRDFAPTVATVGAVAVFAAFTLVVGSPAGNAADRPSSAYAISAEGQVPIPKTPYVESKDGRQRSSSELEVPDNPLISARAGTVTAGHDSATVELLDVIIGQGALSQVKLPPELKAACANLPAEGGDDLPVPKLPLPDLGLPLPELPSTDDLPAKNLRELCELLLTPPSSVLGLDSLNVWCAGDKGGVDVGTLTLLGQKIAIPTTQDRITIPAAPLATITINEQIKRSDGSFTITGVVVNLGEGAEVIRLASATCAKPAPKAKPTPKPSTTQPTKQPERPSAPPPSPIQTRHPVTG